jgi:membrane protease YdiL (CAAX protease family)
MSKRNTYAFFTLFCLITIIALPSFFYSTPQSIKESKWGIDTNALVKSPQARILFSLTSIYLSLICIGVANIAIFFIRKYHKQPLLRHAAEEKQFTLSEEKTSKLIFYATTFVLLVQLLEIFVYANKITTNTVSLALFLNCALELSVSFIVIKYLSSHWLDFSYRKYNMTSLISVYTAALPLVICAALLNNLILKKIGITPLSNPAISIFLHLKSKPLILLLFSQIVLFGPLAEELFFRGFVYKFMRTKFSFIAASAWTSFFFAMLHHTPQDMLPLFFISIALCYLYEKTQNILSPIIFHSIFNTFNFLLLFLLKDFIKI